ncbi:hypothetical protein [Schlesneria sp. T3-172]|uniref:hypothetical protein n=1 Tax=Schlesneria sphaerica TaxID=3373610 RepID=UPI0037C4FAF6
MTSERLLRLASCILASIVLAVPMSADAGIPHSRVARNAAISQARKNYQQQMKLQTQMQAEEQKAVAQEMQKAAEAEAAQEKQKREMRIKANRDRTEREKKSREAAIAKRKAENSAKGDSDNGKVTEPTAKPNASSKPKK